MLIYYVAKQLDEEHALLERKRKEKEEQHLYLQCVVITEENFQSYQGFDLTNWDPDPKSSTTPASYRMLRTSTIKDFCKTVAEDKELPAEQVRLWGMVNRQNKTVRPDQPLVEPDMTVDEAFTKYGSRDRCFRLWLEVAQDSEDGQAIWPDMQPQMSNNIPILVFLKYFNVEAQTLKGVGHLYVKKHSKVSDMVPMILQMMGWSPQSSPSSPSIALYEVCSCQCS